MTPREAFLGPQEVVPAREAVGRVSAESLRGVPARHPERAAGRAAHRRDARLHRGDDRPRRQPARRERPRAADAARGDRGLASATRSRRIACIRQCAPPPPSVNAASSGSYTVRPSARRRSLRSFDSALVSTRSPPRQTPFTPSLSASAQRDGHDLHALRLEPAHEAGPDLLDAHRGELLAEHRGEHVDVEEVRRYPLDADLPAVRLEPAGQLPRGRLLRALLAVPDHGHAGLDDHEVAALERRRR